jgi:hypothetical protein
MNFYNSIKWIILYQYLKMKEILKVNYEILEIKKDELAKKVGLRGADNNKPILMQLI